MFGFAIDLHDVRNYVRHLWAAQTGVWAGAAFVVLASLTIHYEEVFAPHMNRISAAWTHTADSFSRVFSSLSR
jgi:hypothetical protein